MSHKIILNEGDAITEDAIRTLLGRSAVSGYVERGVGITYHEDDTVDVEAGEVHILDPGQGDITIQTDAFVGHELVANAENTLWIVVDPDGATEDDAVSLVSNATGVSPSDPSIEIATVDTNKPPQDNSAVQPSNRGTAAGLDGEDLNPRSLGETERALLVAAETIQGDSGVFDSIEASGGSLSEMSDIATEALSIGPGGKTRVADLDSGPDVCAAVNDALDAVGAGGVVVVPPGDYTIESGAPISTSITGQAPDQTVIAYGATVESENEADALPVRNSADGFTLIGGRWLGNTAPPGGDQSTEPTAYTQTVRSDGADDVSLIDVVGADGRQAIWLGHGKNITLRGCHAKAINGRILNGITLQSCEQITLVGNHVTGFRDTGVWLNQCSDVNSAGYVTESHPEAGSYGYDISGTTDAQLSGTVDGKGVTSNVAYIHPESGDPCENITVDVVAHGIGDNGFSIFDSDDITIRGRIDGRDGDGNVTMSRPWRYASPSSIVDSPTLTIDLDVHYADRSAYGKLVSSGIVTDTSRYVNVNGSGAAVEYAGENVHADVRTTYAGYAEIGDAVSCDANTTWTRTTNDSGNVHVSWGDEYRFKERPGLSASVTDPARSWYVVELDTDGGGLYTGALIKLVDRDGNYVNADVQCTVTLEGQ